MPNSAGAFMSISSSQRRSDCSFSSGIFTKAAIDGSFARPKQEDTASSGQALIGGVLVGPLAFDEPLMSRCLTLAVTFRPTAGLLTAASIGRGTGWGDPRRLVEAGDTAAGTDVRGRFSGAGAATDAWGIA